MEENVKLGKVTAKFAFKFILWMILFFIVGAVIVGIASGGAIANMGNDAEDVEEMFGAVKGFFYGLVVVDLISALFATKLSINGIAKKNKITSENRPKIVKRIAIVLIVISIIVIAIHTVMMKALDSILVEDSGFDSLSELIEEAEDQSDKIEEFLDINEEDEFDDAVELIKGLNTAGHVFAISGLVYVAMIPVSNIFLKKKEEQ